MCSVIVIFFLQQLKEILSGQHFRFCLFFVFFFCFCFLRECRAAIIQECSLKGLAIISTTTCLKSLDTKKTKLKSMNEMLARVLFHTNSLQPDLMPFKN